MFMTAIAIAMPALLRSTLSMREPPAEGDPASPGCVRSTVLVTLRA